MRSGAGLCGTVWSYVEPGGALRGRAMRTRLALGVLSADDSTGASRGRPPCCPVRGPCWQPPDPGLSPRTTSHPFVPTQLVPGTASVSLGTAGTRGRASLSRRRPVLRGVFSAPPHPLCAGSSPLPPAVTTRVCPDIAECPIAEEVGTHGPGRTKAQCLPSAPVRPVGGGSQLPEGVADGQTGHLGERSRSSTPHPPPPIMHHCGMRSLLSCR